MQTSSLLNLAVGKAQPSLGCADGTGAPQGTGDTSRQTRWGPQSDPQATAASTGPLNTLSWPCLHARGGHVASSLTSP